MLNVTDEILNDAIAGLPGTFDTHPVIRVVMRRAPRQYADDLAATTGGDPVLSFHSTIGRRLTRFDHIEKTRKLSSPNVRGETSENQEWRRKA